MFWNIFNFAESVILLMACFVYILGSLQEGKPRTYVGWTNNLGQRLKKHNAGTGARSTRGRQWEFLYIESYQTRSEAMSREWYLKREKPFRSELRNFLTL